MLYLIGLSHNAQVRKQGSSETVEQREFAALLRSSVREVQPDFIAEELTVERLVRESEDSIAREVALEFGVVHRFCDPTEEERSSIGYRDARSIVPSLMCSDRLPFSEVVTKATAIEICQYFPVREQFWLDRLRECPGDSGIFICGDGHIESFIRLLDINRIDWKVAARKVGFVPGENARVQEAMGYLREHPELANWGKCPTPI